MSVVPAPDGVVEPIPGLQGKLDAAGAEIAHLQAALVSARRIGAAIGVLMARRNVTYDEAFELLRQQSQHRNVKLREVAEEVLYMGELLPR